TRRPTGPWSTSTSPRRLERQRSGAAWTGTGALGVAGAAAGGAARPIVSSRSQRRSHGLKVMSRAIRPHVRYEYSQVNSTVMRLRKDTRYRRWMVAHMNQANQPLTSKFEKIDPTADPRPITANEPLSK